MNRPRLTSARALSLLAACLLCACSTPVVPPEGPRECNASAMADVPRFRLLGEVRWNVDTPYGGVPVGGLSSIDWDAARGEYLLISDDRAVFGPARYYSARMVYDDSGLHDAWLTDMHALRGPGQHLYGDARTAHAGMPVPDAEALRVMPGSGDLLWSSEGDFARGFGPELQVIDHDGHWLSTWALPASLSQPDDAYGPRASFTIEGLSFSEDGATLWASMEGALKQDGPMPAPGSAGAPVRITQFDATSRAPLRQIAYQPDALPAGIWALPQRAVNGVSDILADGPEHLLVLERSFSVDFGWGARLYRIDLRSATDTLDMARLEPARFQPATKRLVQDFAQLGLRSVDNLEGMTWGPRLAGGERVLLLMSDNNFNPAQVTQFVALAELPRCNSE